MNLSLFREGNASLWMEPLVHLYTRFSLPSAACGGEPSGVTALLYLLPASNRYRRMCHKGSFYIYLHFVLVCLKQLFVKTIYKSLCVDTSPLCIYAFHSSFRASLSLKYRQWCRMCCRHYGLDSLLI